MPHTPLMSTTPGMDDKTPRLAGFPFPFCPSSSPSSVFPTLPMFPGFQQVYNNFVQAQLMHIAQQQQHHQQQQQQLRAETSPALSENTSSRSESPAKKKLCLDEDGCAACPACGEKLPEAEWAAHVAAEKERLIAHITSIKERTICEPSSNAEQARRKRELELIRIRSNQQKRLALKRGSTALMRDCLTPFSRQSNDETGSSGSPEVKREDDFATIKCVSCNRNSDYGIVISTFDRPRCQSCFDVFRAHSVLLPQSLSSLVDQLEDEPSVKKPKTEIEDE